MTTITLHGIRKLPVTIALTWGGRSITREVRAKTLLQAHKGYAWFGVDYNLNIYRGCQHGCIYCDSRSECYQIDDFDDVQVKVNAVELLQAELDHRRKRGAIGTGAMSDPYVPIESEYRLTRGVLEVIANHGFSVHLVTKSDMVVRDIDILKRMTWRRPSVAITLTTVDDDLARLIEPGAPPPSRRLAAMTELAAAGVCAGVTMMPILPFIEDNKESLRAIVEATAAHGGEFIYPWFGMSLRDRQREHYFRQLDRHFPGLSKRYKGTYGGAYECLVPDCGQLSQDFRARCRALGLAYEMSDIIALMPHGQMTLFE